MTTLQAHLTTATKRAKSSTSTKREKPKASRKPSSAPTAPAKADPVDDLPIAPTTKHNRILTLLSRREGATIPEMMEASGWQQHSVRGFLAGTVKKKLGLTLSSSKAAGEPRRYRIPPKRGR
jgi:hypothetical protein